MKIENIFTQIIAKTIPCKLIGESDFTMAFEDIHPKAKIHVLIIPKKHYAQSHLFFSLASKEEILDFSQFLWLIPKQLDLLECGYQILSNNGLYGKQEVPHFHIHLLSDGK